MWIPCAIKLQLQSVMNVKVSSVSFYKGASKKSSLEGISGYYVWEMFLYKIRLYSKEYMQVQEYCKLTMILKWFWFAHKKECDMFIRMKASEIVTW